MRQPFIILSALLPLLLAADAPDTKPVRTEPTQKPSTKPSEKLSITEHQTTIAGQIIKYKATTGYLTVKDENGKDKANFFFVSYEKTLAETESVENRPITYVFNGGPGAASVWLHLGTAGPMRVKMGDEAGTPPAPPYRLVPNEYSWLDLTDLVFIDPVGTGYSRPAAGEKGEQFWGVREDVTSVGEFIRLYTTRFERWLSPKFLAGESYGTTRAAQLSDYLADRFGIVCNGIVLVSVVLDFQTIRVEGWNDLPYPLYLPSYAVTAWHHKKLSPDLQADFDKLRREVERFTIDQYIPALSRGQSLPADRRKKLAEQIAQYTGLPADYIEKSELRVGPSQFRKMLVEGKVLGRFDSRITGPDVDPQSNNPSFDPSYNGYLGLYSSAISDYLRRNLKYENDLFYEVLSPAVGPWNFGRAGSGYLNVADDLGSAMVKYPHLRLLVASGYYDLATPYFATDYTVNRLDLNPELRKNITQTYYTAGHMMYHEHKSLKQLKDDLTNFLKNAVPPQQNP